MITASIFILICLQGLVLGLTAQIMLKNKYSRLMTMGLWLLCTFLTAVLRIFFYSYSFFKIANTLVSMGGWLLILLFMYEDKRSRKLLVWLILLLNVTLTEMLMMGFMFAFHPDYYNYINSMVIERVAMLLISLFISILIMEVFVILWQKFLSSDQGLHLSLPILFLPVSQILMTLFIDFKNWEGAAYHAIPYMSAQILAFLLNIYWIYWLTEHGRQEARLHELSEIKHTMELERNHYRDIEENRWKTAKIRHDINNQLSSIGYLLDKGELDKARDMLQTISEDLQSTKECAYCDIAIVNAVLNEKAAACEKQDIALTVNIAAPDLGKLPDVQLCSLFGNLMDNAIHAAVNVENINRYIHLAVTEKANLIVIKVQNSSTPPKEIRPGHGIGSQILQEIAEQYQGSYQGTYKDGIYTAIVSIVRVVSGDVPD